MLAALRPRLAVTRPGLLPASIVVLAVLLAAGLSWLVLLLAALVPTVWAVYSRPQRGLLVLAALAPFNGLLLIAPFPSFVAGWRDALILVVLALTFVGPKEARAPTGRRLPGWVPAIAGLVLLGLFSASIVGGTQAQVGLKVSYFNLLVAVSLWRCPFNARERDHFVTILMVAAVLTSLYGLWQQTVGHAYLADLGYQYNEVIKFTSGDRLRSFSSFNQPFPFAFYLMIAMLVGIPQLISEPRRLRNRLFALALPVIGLALVFTFVRAAWLGLALGLGYLAFHRYKILVYAIPLAMVALLFLPTGTFKTAAFGSQSLKERTTSWSQRFSRITTHPFGTGLGSTGAAAEKVAKLQRTDVTLAYQPDNSYLKTTFELGVIGFWLMVMLLGATFLSARAAERRLGGRDRDLAAGTSAVILASAVVSLVATYFEIFPMDLLFWFLVATTATMVWEGSPPEVEATPALESDPAP